VLQDFRNLERHRIRDILLVSSLFDFYLFEEEGLLYERIQTEYHGLQLSHTPELTRVSRGAEALDLLGTRRFDLIITTLHIDDMTPLRLARSIRERVTDTPIVLLAYDKRELSDLITHHGASDFDRVFIWRGDPRLLVAIIKNLEDEANVAEDTSNFGVQVILVNEDSVRYASFFLPLLYSEVIEHSQRLMAEGLNAAHRALRMRARPKILLRSNWEEAIRTLERYEHHVIGVITDAGFPVNGEPNPRAGIAFTREVKRRFWDIPVLLQSTDASLEREATAAGACFLPKHGPSFVEDVRRVLREYFAFGDFVFRSPAGEEVGRAKDLRSLEEELARVPDAILLHHAARNDFSNWIKARTEFRLAERLRPRKVSDYESVAEMRADILRQLREHRSFRQQGLFVEFNRHTFDPSTSFARTGGGSVGGKARGLAFLNMLLSTENVRASYDDLAIDVPPGVVIGTDVFDQFLDENHLRAFALGDHTDEEILQRFLAAPRFPAATATRLGELLDLVHEPLAVRSSSLLEDGQFHPFAGVYQTFMIPNRADVPTAAEGGRLHTGLADLLTAIKRVYASTFYRAARDYVSVTGHRIEAEKMAVIVQKLAGARHGSRFYPEISGVARSWNFYPAGPQKPDDGIVSVALGLGKTIVEGGVTVRFSPRYPDHLQQSFRDRSQTMFYALDMDDTPREPSAATDERILSFDLKAAESDGTLQWVASTYSAENDALYPGIARAGRRIVTFAPVLQHRLLPLAGALGQLCELGAWGVGAPIEIEFAVDVAGRRLHVLQMRPLVLSREMDELDIGDIPRADLLCQSEKVLGHGVIRDLHDVVVVDIGTFDRSRSLEAAREVAMLNAMLLRETRGYLLVGPGRWGSLDPHLGIPVKWEQISGAKTVVETGFRDMAVDPSEGSHFFQNLTAFQVGYFTVSERVRNSFVDWSWLALQRATAHGPFVRHIHLERGVTVKMNGRERRGVILK
jgi:CheY-like chemotaxis protein